MNISIATIVSTALGGILVLVANYVTQSVTSKSDRKKLMREKVEQMYMLSIRIKSWAQVQMYDICLEMGLEPIDFYNTQGTRQSYTFWLVSEPAHNLECPIEELDMLIGLYTPELKDIGENYRSAIVSINAVYTFAFVKKDVFEKGRAREDFQKFEKLHILLQAALQRLISKYS